MNMYCIYMQSLSVKLSQTLHNNSCAHIILRHITGMCAQSNSMLNN